MLRLKTITLFCLITITAYSSEITTPLSEEQLQEIKQRYSHCTLTQNRSDIDSMLVKAGLNPANVVLLESPFDEGDCIYRFNKHIIKHSPLQYKYGPLMLAHEIVHAKHNDSLLKKQCVDYYQKLGDQVLNCSIIGVPIFLGAFLACPWFTFKRMSIVTALTTTSPILFHSMVVPSLIKSHSRYLEKRADVEGILLYPELNLAEQFIDRNKEIRKNNLAYRAKKIDEIKDSNLPFLSKQFKIWQFSRNVYNADGDDMTDVNHPPSRERFEYGRLLIEMQKDSTNPFTLAEFHKREQAQIRSYF